MTAPLRLVKVSPARDKHLAQLFEALHEAGDEKTFRPHALTPDAARERAQYQGLDAYYILMEGNEALGYGMLRGWDEGYEVPSLGIAVHPRARGRGLGRRMMELLHEQARLRGARHVRLKSDRSNAAALSLYRSLGYRFTDDGGPELVGTLDLD
jgi:ribosomal protein S18 acetylase RimI-like enzyme